MTLTTTPGASTADAYASLAAALAYHAAMGNAGWASAVDADRETALRRATKWIDATYRKRWIGFRVNGRAQPLDWPQTGVFDRDGFAVDSTTIPDEVVNATCEAALRELTTPGMLLPDYVPAERVKTASAGPVSITYADSKDATDVLPILAVVEGILSRLIYGDNRALGGALTI